MKNLEKLVSGYKKFLKHDDTSRIRTLAIEGQSPKVMVIGCSDSRVNPDLIFNAVPGDLFVVRNIASLVPPFELDEASHGTSAALEFAVKTLNVAHIVILGHSICGGVRACCDGMDGHEIEGIFLPKWTSIINNCAQAVRAENPDVDDATLTQKVEHASIKNSLKNLLDFPFVVEALNAGRLQVHGAYFDIREAQLYALDKETDSFKAIE
tara:strand:+ start:8956 stop:9585 length:630 start_codon:yes stop_codon:yes gene_type:complete